MDWGPLWSIITMAPFDSTRLSCFVPNALSNAADDTAIYYGIPDLEDIPDFPQNAQPSESEMEDDYSDDDSGVLQSGFGAGYRYRGPADVDEDYVPSDSDDDELPSWYLPSFYNAYNSWQPVYVDLTVDSDNEDSDLELTPWNPLVRRQRAIEGGHVCMECEEANRRADTFIMAVCRECSGRLCSSCCDDIKEANQSDEAIPSKCPYCERGKQPYAHRQ